VSLFVTAQQAIATAPLTSASQPSSPTRSAEPPQQKDQPVEPSGEPKPAIASPALPHSSTSTHLDAVPEHGDAADNASNSGSGSSSRMSDRDRFDATPVKRADLKPRPPSRPRRSKPVQQRRVHDSDRYSDDDFDHDDEDTGTGGGGDDYADAGEQGDHRAQRASKRDGAGHRQLNRASRHAHAAAADGVARDRQPSRTSRGKLRARSTTRTEAQSDARNTAAPVDTEPINRVQQSVSASSSMQSLEQELQVQRAAVRERRLKLERAVTLKQVNNPAGDTGLPQSNAQDNVKSEPASPLEQVTPALAHAALLDALALIENRLATALQTHQPAGESVQDDGSKSASDPSKAATSAVVTAASTAPAVGKDQASAAATGTRPPALDVDLQDFIRDNVERALKASPLVGACCACTASYHYADSICLCDCRVDCWWLAHTYILKQRWSPHQYCSLLHLLSRWCPL